MRLGSGSKVSVQLVAAVGLAIFLSALSVSVAAGQPLQDSSTATVESAGAVPEESVQAASGAVPLLVQEPGQAVGSSLSATHTAGIQIAVWEDEVNNPPERGSMELRNADGQTLDTRNLFDSSVQTFSGLVEGERYSVVVDIANWPERTYDFKAGSVDEKQLTIGYEFKGTETYQWNASEDEGNTGTATRITGVRLSDHTHSYQKARYRGGNRLGSRTEWIGPALNSSGVRNVMYLRDEAFDLNESKNNWKKSAASRAEYSPPLPIHKPVNISLAEYQPEPVAATTIDGMAVDVFEIDLSKDPNDPYANEYGDALAYVNQDTGYVVRIETDTVVRVESGGLQAVFGSYRYDFACHTCGDDIDPFAPVRRGVGLPPSLNTTSYRPEG